MLKNCKETMMFAYIRVSTQVQTSEGQRYEIEKWCRRRNMHVDRWVEEKISGLSGLNKRTLGKTLRRMRKGDVLVCTELSRLGRNMMMVMSILNQCSQRGISVYSIKDHFELSDSINSKIIAFSFSLAAEIERNLISQRTREALAAKKEAGVRLGRPKGKSKQQKDFEQMLPELRKARAEGASFKLLAEKVGIHRNTLYRYLKATKEGEQNEKP